MSVKSVGENISSALANDGRITHGEMQKILSEEDPIFSAPVSLGSRIDEDEFARLKLLKHYCSGGAISADSDAIGLLEQTISRFEDRVRYNNGNFLAGGAVISILSGLGTTLVAGSVLFIREAGSQGSYVFAAGFGAIAGLMIIPEGTLALLAIGGATVGAAGAGIYYYTND